MSPPEALDFAGAPLLGPIAAVAASGGDVLIAGSPTFIAEYVAGEWSVPADSGVGVVRRPSGSLAFVPPPGGMAATNISGVRAVSAARGGWDVVFARQDTLADPPADVELWSGHLSRELQWSGLRSHTLAGVVSAGTRLASGLAASDSEMSLALQAEDRGFPTELLIVSIRGSSWYVNRRPPVPYATLEYDDRGDPLGLFVHTDTALAQDQNSLFLYQREGREWSSVRKLHAGLGDPAHRPDLLFLDGFIAAWLTGLSPPRTGRAHLLVQPEDPKRSRHYILSDTAGDVSVFGWGQNAYALVQQRAYLSQPDELVLYAVSPDAPPRVAATAPDPFMAQPLVAAVSPSELLLVDLTRRLARDGTPRLPYINTVRVTRSCRR